MVSLKRVITAGSVIAALALTAACGAKEPEGPFITPTPSSESKSSTAPSSANPNEAVPTDIPTEKPGAAVPEVDLMPFQYDWTTYEVSQEAKDRWGEEMAVKALPRALEALETAYSLTNAWEGEERTVQDFEVLRDYLTPEMWGVFEEVIPNKDVDPTNLMAFVMYRVPNMVVLTTDGQKFTPTGMPLAQMTENPRMTIVQDEATFGDLEHRYTLGATFTYTFFGSLEDGQQVSATYERDVAVYLKPVGDQWYVSGWYASDMVPVA